MRTLCNILLLILITTQIKATNQIEDILYHGQDTLYLYDSPLEKIDSITTKIFSLKKDIDYSSDCWRGFRAEWKIINDILYLSNVYECNTGNNLNSTIEQILGQKFKNGLIKTDWVTGYFWAGKNFVWEQTLYISIFQHEFKLDFINGHLNNINRFDYKLCEFSDKERITEFVLNQLDWDKLPDIADESFYISAYAQSDTSGKITKIKIESSGDSRFNDAVLKALYKLPCMTVYYNRGRFWDVGNTIYIKINKDNIDKYVR